MGLSYPLRRPLGALDSFARTRVSSPQTLFDSKQIFDKLPLLWDDQEVSGSGTDSVHDADTACTEISVADATAGKRTRQTFRRFNYQPGKSQLVMLTFAKFDTLSGITKRVGYFDDDNGLFFQSADGVLSVVRRSNATGTPVDEVVEQADWTLYKLDGTDDPFDNAVLTAQSQILQEVELGGDLDGSPITLDPAMSQIGLIDFEWLGVGTARMGFVIDGHIYYVHTFLNANVRDTVYMSTPNLPLRYEIESTGGAASSLATICSSVISEGGSQKTGVIRSVSSGNVQCDADAADTLYAAIGIRLKAAYVGATVELERFSMLVETNDAFEWSLWWNPTVAGTFTYGDQTNSSVQTALGSTTNTVTGGTLIDSGYASTASSVSHSLTNALLMGAAIDGTVDEVVLCVRPIGTNADIQSTLTWREIL